MNPFELSNAIAQDLQIGGYDADRFLKATLGKIVEVVTSKQPVKLVGFGTFSMRPQAPHIGTVLAKKKSFGLDGDRQQLLTSLANLKLADALVI